MCVGGGGGGAESVLCLCCVVLCRSVMCFAALCCKLLASQCRPNVWGKERWMGGELSLPFFHYSLPKYQNVVSVHHDLSPFIVSF